MPLIIAISVMCIVLVSILYVAFKMRNVFLQIFASIFCVLILAIAIAGKTFLEFVVLPNGQKATWQDMYEIVNDDYIKDANSNKNDYNINQNIKHGSRKENNTNLQSIKNSVKNKENNNKTQDSSRENEVNDKHEANANNDGYSKEEEIDGEVLTVSDDERKLPYFTSRLSSKELENLNIIKDGLSKRMDVIKLAPGMNFNSFEKVIYTIRFEYPEYFFIAREYKYTEDKSTDTVLTFSPQYTISVDTYNEMMNKINTFVETLKSKLDDKSDYEKEIFVHNLIAENCTYDLNTPNTSNMYGALFDHRASCEGYSSAFYYIMKNLGFEVLQVIGDPKIDSSEASHSWNMINLGGNYYHVDVCWDDLDANQMIHHSYFNVADAEILKTRDMAKTHSYLGNPPVANSTKYNFYGRTGSLVHSIDEAENKIRNELPVAIDTKNNIVLKCDNQALYDNIKKNIQNILQKAVNNTKTNITEYSYIPVDDTYTLILVINK